MVYGEKDKYLYHLNYLSLEAQNAFQFQYYWYYFACYSKMLCLFIMLFCIGFYIWRTTVWQISNQIKTSLIQFPEAKVPPPPFFLQSFISNSHAGKFKIVHVWSNEFLFRCFQFGALGIHIAIQGGQEKNETAYFPKYVDADIKIWSNFSWEK